ncbi:autotransporter assembly complex protein TamA [Massilia sp. PWRC2]|uniref:autotransporter assembly complex protein TamA n=1 Tax=Massilia sp. PWRC2 TaxID=2804626 RepID=UPI003CEE5BE8
MAFVRPRILAQIGLAVCTLPLAVLAQELPAVVPTVVPDDAVNTAATTALTYTVRIDAPDPIDTLLQDNLDLVRWRGNPRLDRNQLQRLIKATPDQVRTLVATEGYYSPTVTAGLDAGAGVPQARVTVDPGRPVLVGDIDLVLQGFEPLADTGIKFDGDALRARWALPVGARFRTADWEDAKRALLRQVMQVRYPRAQLLDSQAVVDPDQLRAVLKVVLDSGPEVHLGELRIEGLKRYPAVIITNLNPIKPGTEYSEATLQAFQAKLQDTGYFSGVEVSADMSAMLDDKIEALTDDQDAPATAAPPRPRAGGLVTTPVLVRVTENKQKNVSAGLGLSTNTGKRAQLTYDDLAVLGLRFKSALIFETLRQSARGDLYWPTTAQGYSDSVGTGFERTDLQGERTSVSTVAAKRAWGTPLLEHSVTLEYLNELRNVDGQPTSSSKSVPLTYNLTRRKLDNLLSPTVGYAFNAQLGGAVLPLLTDQRFLRATARIVTYRPLGSSGTLILRADAGAVASRQKAGVPSTFLFRAGGDQSVRGYAYQQLGIAQGSAIVPGRYLASASAEYQYWFKPPYGIAFFYDAGNAADSLRELHPKSGYGVGGRWRSPVGPINVDVAYGHAVKQVRLHFSLGFTF